MANEKEQDQPTTSNNGRSSSTQVKQTAFDDRFGPFLLKRAFRWFAIFTLVDVVVVLLAYLNQGGMLGFLLMKLMAFPAFIVAHWCGKDELQTHALIALALSTVFYTAVFVVVDTVRFKIKKSKQARAKFL